MRAEQVKAISPNLIVVSGLPSSGKSTLAERVQSELAWPLLAKDAYKEMLFDTLGIGDREWSRRLSVAAYALQFAQLRQLLACGHSCIVEGNFRWSQHASTFAALTSAESSSRPRIIQLHCHAEPKVLIERFRERSTKRHPGHVDVASADEIETELLTAQQEPLPISGTIIRCDTSNDWRLAMDNAVAELMTLVED